MGLCCFFIKMRPILIEKLLEIPACIPYLENWVPNDFRSNKNSIHWCYFTTDFIFYIDTEVVHREISAFFKDRLFFFDIQLWSISCIYDIRTKIGYSNRCRFSNWTSLQWIANCIMLLQIYNIVYESYDMTHFLAKSFSILSHDVVEMSILFDNLKYHKIPFSLIISILYSEK